MELMQRFAAELGMTPSFVDAIEDPDKATLEISPR
jgi:hypothetical protein